MSDAGTRRARAGGPVGTPPAEASRDSGSPDETQRLGAAFAATLATGDLIGLVGELGSGKTRFVQGMARGLAAAARVRSPTFTLVNEYPGRVRLIHVDLYRLDAPDPLELGLEELAQRGAVVVEWADRLPRRWRDEAFEIEFRVTGDATRRLAGRARGDRAVALLEAWRALAPTRDGV